MANAPRKSQMTLANQMTSRTRPRSGQRDSAYSKINQVPVVGRVLSVSFSPLQIPIPGELVPRHFSTSFAGSIGRRTTIHHLFRCKLRSLGITEYCMNITRITVPVLGSKAACAVGCRNQGIKEGRRKCCPYLKYGRGLRYGNDRNKERVLYPRQWIDTRFKH